MKIFSVGHSTFRLELDDRVIFTDPWFTTSGITYHVFTRRIFPLAIRPGSIDRCDLMLVSHDHMDHLSREAFEVARRLDSCVAGPHRVIRRARLKKVSRLHELEPGKRMTLGNIAVAAVPAVHPLSRDAVGFLLEGRQTVYFSGDTRFDWSIVDQLRGKAIDVAILQVSCAFYPWLSGADGMDLAYAEELAKAIRPRYVVPMHFDCAGKYLDLQRRIRVNERSLDVENALGRFERRLEKSGIECVILYSGETIEL